MTARSLRFDHLTILDGGPSRPERAKRLSPKPKTDPDEEPDTQRNWQILDDGGHGGGHLGPVVGEWFCYSCQSQWNLAANNACEWCGIEKSANSNEGTSQPR